MNRRSFLAAIFSAAAAGTLLTDTRVAQAISLFPEDRISKAVSRARLLIEPGREIMAHEGWKNADLFAAYAAQADDLFVTMTKDFPDLPTMDEAIFLMDGLIRVGLSESEMRGISEDLVPLAIGRHLASVELLPFNSGRMPAFGEYLERNRAFILGHPESMTAAGRSAHELPLHRLTEEQAGRVLALYYAARNAGRLDQPLELTTETVYGVAPTA